MAKKPDKSEIESLYDQEGTTLSSLARKYGTTHPTIRNWLISYGINIKSQKQASAEANNRNKIRSKPSKEVLEKLYEESSIKSLETYFSVGQQTLYEWFKEHDIPIRTLEDSCKKGKERQFQNIQFDRDFLDKKYDRNKSLDELAKKLNVSRSHIRNQLKKNNIEIVPLEPTYRSKAEVELYEYFKSKFPNDEWNFCDRNVIHPYELDIVNHTKKIAVEYCGIYWHSESSRGKDKMYHKRKYEMCRNAGYKLITVFESDDIEKVKSLVIKIMGNTRKIGARKTEIIRLAANQARDFHNAHHLHSSVGSKYHYGLQHSELGLLMVASFGANRFSKNQEYECTRITSHSNITVVGGVSKLIKHFIKEQSPKSIITFADLRFGDGNVYNKCGFDFVENTPPNYWYTFKHSPNLYSRVKFQKHKLKDKLEFFDPTLTEYENMLDNGWDRIWDCGNAKYVWKK